MPVIQISKIQLRRGAFLDLTQDSLDAGEMAFATDEGRLFIGPDPDQTGSWSVRDTPPYNNIEVLTETSLETFARLFDRLHRTMGPVGLVEGAGTFDRKPFLEATLAANTTAWTPVDIARINQSTGLFDGATEELVLMKSDSGAALVEYFILDTGAVLRTGLLKVLHTGVTNDVALMSDECVSYRGNTSSAVLISTLISGVEFRAVRATDGETRIRLEYKNANTSSYTLQLRAMVAARLNP